MAKISFALGAPLLATHVPQRMEKIMVSTSNDGIMSEYLIKYGAAKTSEHERPAY